MLGAPRPPKCFFLLGGGGGSECNGGIYLGCCRGMLNRLQSNRQSVCSSADCIHRQQLAAEGQWQGNYGVTWTQSVCRRPPSWKGVFPLISLTRGEAPSANGRLKFITGVSAAIMLPWIAGCKKVLTGAAGHQRVMKRKQKFMEEPDRKDRWGRDGRLASWRRVELQPLSSASPNFCFCVKIYKPKLSGFQRKNGALQPLENTKWLK